MPTRHPSIFPISGLLALMSSTALAGDVLWRDAPAETSRTSARTPSELPAAARRVVLDRGAFQNAMQRLRKGDAARSLELPLPTGGTTTFKLERSGVLPPGLASRYPDLESMRGQDEQGRRVRVDMGPNGVSAAVSDPGGDWLVRPETPGTAGGQPADTYHAVFRRSDAARRPHGEAAGTAGDAARAGQSEPPPAPRVYRTFRIAVTATPSYTQRHGGTRAQALQGIVTAVNRVNRIYERDLGVHLVLAEDSDKLIFTPDGASPFDDLSVTDDNYDLDMALRNVEVVSKVLDNEAFDVGHLLDARSNSGVAGAIGNTCTAWTGKPEHRAFAKAAGMTGHTQPFGDPFHVDFVAHELGHQFGASHTFNGCSSRGWAQGTAVEPGSGSTVMGYAGLCPERDLQQHSDDYFHGVTIEEVANWLSRDGGACARAEPVKTRTPWMNTEGWNRPMVVPARTPFQLAALARFADENAQLSYTFEQMDLGDFQFDAKLADRGSGPLFRSRKPNSLGVQTFPAMSVLLGHEKADLGDTLPTSDRRLRFRMTVRDEEEGLRTPAIFAERTVRVVDTGQAFAVTAPADNAVLRRGRPRTVLWDTAGTAERPVACPTVRIDLSVDGGLTFLETPLAGQVPNEGHASVDIPAGIAPSTEARLRVACADGRFFAISSALRVR